MDVKLNKLKNRLKHIIGQRSAERIMTRTFTDFQSLDEFLDRVESLGSVDEMKAGWAQLKLHSDLLDGYPKRLQSLDPFSEEYERTVRDFFRLLQGSEYNVDNECLDIDIEYLSRVGYPYSTRSPDTVGSFLIAYGFIIKSMNLPITSRILDIGTGAGSLTIHLARMGYDLTCVDVNPQFVELMSRLTKNLPNKVECILSEMNDLELNSDYDAVLFMESFHHSARHRKTIETIKKFLKPDGSIFFAAEPIVEKECEILPYPWGPRLDGESIRSIRKYGWIEIGFTKPYFDEMLRRQGLWTKRMRSPETHWADLIVARKPPNLRVGSNLKFDPGGLGLSFLGEGWSNPEPFGIWSCDQRAILTFEWPKDVRRLQLTFKLRVFLHSPVESQDVMVSLGGATLVNWHFQGTHPYVANETLELRREAISDESLVQLVFFVDHPTSPKSVGAGEDTRLLGIALEDLIVKDLGH